VLLGVVWLRRPTARSSDPLRRRCLAGPFTNAMANIAELGTIAWVGVAIWHHPYLTSHSR
jgi:hypothetical protein